MNRPPFLVFPQLSSDRVLLREILHEDAGELLEIMSYDGKPAQTTDEVIFMLNKIDGNYRHGESVNWGIEEKATGKLAGICGYYRGFEDSTGEIGFVLRPAFRGKGLMSETLQLAARFGREIMELENIIAITKPSNKEAIRLLARNQFSYKGDYNDTYIEFEYAEK